MLKLAVQAGPGEEHDPAGLVEPLYLALRQGLADQAEAMLFGAFLEGCRLAELFDGPLQQALERLGELWTHDPAGIAIEHRATSICVDMIARLVEPLPVPSGGAPVAVGAGPAGDPYLLPSQMITAVLTETGLRAINLGPDTPLDTLVRAAELHRARLVWLSLTSQSAAGAAIKHLPSLAARLNAAGRQLVVGGQALPAGRFERTEHVVVIRTLAELAAYARGLLTASDQNHAQP